MESGLTKQQIISELTKSPHKDLNLFTPVSTKAVKEDPEFFAHLIAWNAKNGQIRDSKVALPVIALAARSQDTDQELLENAVAHIADLDPRMLVRAVTFSRGVKGPTRVVRRLVQRFLRDLEASRRDWERVAVQHRASLKFLYGRRDLRIAPAGKKDSWADEILFKNHYAAGSVFQVISKLHDMSPIEAAGAIQKYHIPFLVIQGALGSRLKEPDIALAMINSMSPTELVTNMKLLETMGVKNDPALRGALETAIGKASGSKKNVLKTAKAATYAREALENENLSKKMEVLQERQLDQFTNVEGNWLIFGDISHSMQQSIGLSVETAAFLARVVKGRVHLMFGNTTARYIDATGKTLDELKKATRLIVAGGNTSLGCGLQYLLDDKIEVDGIVIVSDGGENTPPFFASVYSRYCQVFSKEIPVYFYRVSGDPNRLSSRCEEAEIEVQEFDLTSGTVDSYSIPNLVATMRTNRYGLIQAIMDTPLLTIDEVLKRTKGVEIFAQTTVQQAQYSNR